MATDVYLFLSKPALPEHLREAHPYGPGPTGFHADLAIEIDPSHLDKNEAVAVVSGIARVILDPLSPQTCTMALMPSLESLEDLKLVTGGSIVVFVYRNLVKPVERPVEVTQFPNPTHAEFRLSIEILHSETPNKPIEAPTPEEQWNQFIKGEAPARVEAGLVLFPPSTIGGMDNWGHLGFEIVFVPSGLWGEAGWNRLKELIKPEGLTRRLDPASFYALVQAATFGVSLAQDHIDHPLLTITTRRTLIELRTENDLPFEGFFEIQKDANPADIYESKKDNRGTIAVETVSGNTIPSGNYKVSRSTYVFTELPSGSKAYDSLTVQLTAPAHWAMQALFMADIDDPQENWFVKNNQTIPLSICTANNTVTPIIDGVNVFAAYANAIRTLTNSDHYMYLAGWILMIDFELEHHNKIDSRMDRLLKRAWDSNARVRVMLWKQPKDRLFPISPPANKLESDEINYQGKDFNVQSILDDYTHDCFFNPTPTGTHHQKFLVVSGDQGRIAYCGGVDINRNRRDSANHGAPAGYHDVHAEIRGPAVADIERVFAARWNSHPENMTNESKVPVPSGDLDEPSGSVFVQVACTFPRITSNPYSFAPNGSFTPLEALRRAIHKAEKFIYIEDQYLTPYAGHNEDFSYDPSSDDLGVLFELREALSRIDYLIMVIPNFASLGWLSKITPHEGQCRYRRQQFINCLSKVAPTKVHVFFLGRRWPQQPRLDLGEVATEGDGPGTSGSEGKQEEMYCHSKVWMVDDVVAKIGSANCNSRSYTHDSEMDIVMVDGALSNGARAFARNFRMKLWGEHLGMSGSPDNELLEDYKLAREFWLRNPQPFNSHVRPYEQDKFIEDFHTGWTNLIDPDSRKQY